MRGLVLAVGLLAVLTAAVGAGDLVLSVMRTSHQPAASPTRHTGGTPAPIPANASPYRTPVVRHRHGGHHRATTTRRSHRTRRSPRTGGLSGSAAAAAAAGGHPVLSSVLPAAGGPGQAVVVRGLDLVSSNGIVLARVDGRPTRTDCTTRDSCDVTIPALGGPPRVVALTITTTGGTSNVLRFGYR